jgi:hypothetical protein
MTRGAIMRFARWVFLLAGVYGLLVMAPQFFLEEQIGREQPPPITHPEYFYGFVGVVLAWQVLFLVIASDPVRFRPAMLPAVLEKLSFAVAVPLLYLQQRVAPVVVVFAAVDAVLAVLFILAFLWTPRVSERRAP